MTSETNITQQAARPTAHADGRMLTVDEIWRKRIERRSDADAWRCVFSDATSSKRFVRETVVART